VREGVAAYAHAHPVTSDIDAADVVVAVVGETADMSGEAHSRVHLGLPADQQALIDELAQSGKPLVVVLMAGRPLVVPQLVEQASGVLLAWHGGIRTGRAVADLLFGVVAPSGRLVVSFPRSEGQIPVYYAHKNTGRPAQGEGTKQFDEPYRSNYIDEPNAPLFPFGFGLGYSTFSYTDLLVGVESPVSDRVVARVTVENTGSRNGVEVVQLYVQDLVASVTRPVRELKAFQRVSLAPGEARQVLFEVPVDRLGFTGLDMRYATEPGVFKLRVGPDSANGLEASFRI
jgi:beta-glucosidase